MDDEQKPSAADALEAWLVEHIHNTAVAQDTPRYSRVRALVEQIKREIQDLT